MEPWLFNLPGFTSSNEANQKVSRRFVLLRFLHFVSFQSKRATFAQRNQNNVCCQVRAIIYQLIDLTIAEKNFYPSVQTKIWGNIGRMADITDLALDCFFEASLLAGLGSVKVNIGSSRLGAPSDVSLFASGGSNGGHIFGARHSQHEAGVEQDHSPTLLHRR